MSLTQLNKSIGRIRADLKRLNKQHKADEKEYSKIHRDMKKLSDKKEPTEQDVRKINKASVRLSKIHKKIVFRDHLALQKQKKLHNTIFDIIEAKKTALA